VDSVAILEGSPPDAWSDREGWETSADNHHPPALAEMLRRCLPRTLQCLAGSAGESGSSSSSSNSSSSSGSVDAAALRSEVDGFMGYLSKMLSAKPNGYHQRTLEGVAAASLQWQRSWQKHTPSPSPPPSLDEGWGSRQQTDRLERDACSTIIDGADWQQAHAQLLTLGVPPHLLGETEWRSEGGGGWGLERMAQRWGLAAALRHAERLLLIIQKYKGE